MKKTSYSIINYYIFEKFYQFNDWNLKEIIHLHSKSEMYNITLSIKVKR